MKPIDVSIVVCTYNRAARLPAALGSLAALRLGGRTAEILVVDNASTDDTPAVVERFAATSPLAVRRVLETRQGVVHARNRGVTEARGEWIAFFDDDQLADPDWIAKLFALAERHGTKCVGGAVRLALPPVWEDGAGLSPVVRMLLGESVGMTEERRYNRRLTPGCGNLMLHREVFERVGTFDPEWANRGEDTDLWLRIDDAGFEGWFTPLAVIHHVIPAERLTEAYLVRLSRVMAEGMAENEHADWGRLYPFVWLARVGQVAGVLWPRWLWARLRGDRAGALGTHCRMTIAGRYLLNGWRSLKTFGLRRPGSDEGAATEKPGLSREAVPSTAASTIHETHAGAAR